MILKRDTFADEMRREHRTIQQLDAPAIFAVIKQWSHDYQTGNFDARNAATCKLAFDMVDSMTDVESVDRLDCLFFPYI